MNPSIITGLFLSTFCFGPVGGAAYAAAYGLSELATIAILCLINAAIVLIWFGIFGAVNNRLSNFLTRKKNNHLSDYLQRKRKDFRKTSSRGTLALAGFAFIFGSLWATIAAYVLNLKKTTALISVTIGAVFGGALLTLGSFGIIWFLPNPWILYAVAMCVTTAIVAKKVVENQVLVKEVMNIVRRRMWGES